MMKLTTEQTEAISCDGNNIVVIAGPGSGKTEVLAQRIRNDLGQGTDPDKTVVITFTNFAADVVRARLRERVEEDVVDAIGYIGTLHGFMLNLLRSEGHRIGLPNRVTVIDEEVADQLLATIAGDHGWKKPLTEIKTKIAERAFTIHSTPGSAPLAAGELIASAYIRTMLQDGMVDFDTILGFGFSVIHTAHWDNFPERFYVDELQDSSDADFKIYQALPAANRFYVGDPDQAIYGWRGGRVLNLVRLARSSEWNLVLLEGNHRCGRLICEQASNLIQNNVARVNKRTVCVNERLGRMNVFGYEREALELNGAVNWFQSMPPGKTGAVLCRTNKLVEAFEKWMTAADVKQLSTSKDDVRPIDWNTARKFVSLLASPDNDILAKHFLSSQRGEKYAEQKAIEAMDRGLSINRACLHLPEELPVAELPDVLCKCMFGVETVAAVKVLIGRLNPGGGLSELALLMAESRQHDAGNARVLVTTIHRAKGLEFDWVQVAGCEDEIFPGNKTGEQLEEERRLMFVAATRAREQLRVTWARTRANPYTKHIEEHKPSRFIEEIGAL